jgi:pyruvate/2-oxoglutarate/acetoin dehydrogenase E1 component
MTAQTDDDGQGAQRRTAARDGEADPKVVLAGEDIGKLGGVFRITEHLQKDFGEDRVIDCAAWPRVGIVGTAIGMALRGYRPVVEIQFDGFVYPAFDQIVSQVAEDALAGRAGTVSRADRDPHPVRRRHRGRSSTTASRPRPTSRTRSGLKVVVSRQRPAGRLPG